MEYWKLGCRWGSRKEGKPLFYDFLTKHRIVIGWEDRDYGLNASVLLTDGHTALGIAKTTGVRKSALEFPELETEILELEIDLSEQLYVYDAIIVTLEPDEQFAFQTQVGICRINNLAIQNQIKKVLANKEGLIMENELNDKYLKLLEYKKQIILQGPPGTGKTRKAKQIAEAIIAVSNADKQTISKDTIQNFLQVGLKFRSAKDIVEYEVEKITDTGISIIASTKKTYLPLYKEIIQAYNDEIWKKDRAITNGNDSYSAAIAKHIYHEQEKLKHSEQIKIIQFHPSYTYEDFVRGIVSKPNNDGDGIIYEAENQLLAAFAQKALENYLKSNPKDIPVLTIKSSLQRFIDHVISSLDESPERKYPISEAIHIWYVDEKRFKYKGEDWKGHPNGLNMNFDQLETILENNLTERSEINKFKTLNSLTRSHATYYANVVAKYKEFTLNNPPIHIPDEPLKKFVLIIDEINRANLSSVLGELIYALEYRNEKVRSIYKDEKGSNELVLPDNLYIIGTMNTADRSVGHIDYAIRRRFAFVDLLPEILTNNKEINFDLMLFNAVTELFTTDNYKTRSEFLSSEFDPKDVALGHSYFIQKLDKNGTKTPDNMNVRLDFEIKPILFEYVKDGVLKESAVPKINSLKISK